ncbi:MAG: mannose-6-phosphate isomerase, partial [Bacteroidales bacterium]|nr:mannose-6-phosphate isomerase [Bacteroidales bacterium]
MKSNYDKSPFIEITGDCYEGWDVISSLIKNSFKNASKSRFVVAVESYQGVYHEELIQGFKQAEPDFFVHTDELLLAEDRIRGITFPDVTDDRLFGYMTRLQLSDLIDGRKVENIRRQIRETSGMTVVYGYGASLVAEQPDVLVYADMARWEIQRRQRLHEVNNIGIRNKAEDAATQYKRGFFVDWRMCDRQKKKLFEKADYWLDSH